MMSLISKRAVFWAMCRYGLVSRIANSGNYRNGEIKALAIVDKAAVAG